MCPDGRMIGLTVSDLSSDSTEQPTTTDESFVRSLNHRLGFKSKTQTVDAIAEEVFADVRLPADVERAIGGTPAD